MLHSDDHSAGRLDESLDTADTLPPAPLGRRAFIAGTAGAVAATAVGSSAQAAPPAGASFYEPVEPVRLADTRRYSPYQNESKNFQRLNDRKIRIDIKNSPYATVPSDAVAVVVSFAVVYDGPIRHSRGWVKVVPSGTSSEVSNVNVADGDGVIANLATVRLGSGGSATSGKIDVEGKEPYDVIVDIVGVYRATSGAKREGRMEFLPATRRALTATRMTRKTWRTVSLPYIPTSAQAVVVNLTATNCRSRGFLTALAERTPGNPGVSNLNYLAGEVRAVGAIVKLGQTNGLSSIEVYCHGDAEVLVDVTAYITGVASTSKEEGLFVPTNPTRVIDTRRAADFARTGKQRLWPNWTRAFELPNNTGGFGPRSQMKGVAMNATVVKSIKRGFLTVLPAQTVRNEVSNLNAVRAGQVVANHVITEVSTRGVEMFAHCGGDVLADIAGWYVGPQKSTTYTNPTFDPPPPEAAFNWTLTVPRMGLQNFVIPNIFSGDPVVDSGNTWHWTNTGMIGAGNASIVVFGHRTSKGGPYRNQHLLVSNDRLYIDTPDQRRYEYRFVREQLTGDSPAAILNAARMNAAGTTFTLVACTGSSTIFDDQPRGGIRFRIVSTFVLDKWTDTRPNVG